MKRTKRTLWRVGLALLALLFVAGIVLWVVCGIHTANLLDEFYFAFPSANLKNLNRPDTRALLGDCFNYEREYKLSYGSYYAWECEELPDGHEVWIVVNKRRHTVKFIDQDGESWYKYTYNAGEKTLVYETNVREETERAEEHKDFLFSFVLGRWMEERGSERYSLENPGEWEGVRP